MSQQNSNSVQNKQLVIALTRYGQLVGIYNKFDDVLVIVQDYISKGLTFDLSAKYVQ